jgi:CrcB protein
MNGLIAYSLVAVGGAVGSMARYAVTLAATKAWGPEFPWGTILINVLGSFLITFVDKLTAPDGLAPANQVPRILVMVGFCGGFTTFSAFSLQTLELAQLGHWVGVGGNILLSVFLCLAAAGVGYSLAGLIGAAPGTEH